MHAVDRTLEGSARSIDRTVSPRGIAGLSSVGHWRTGAMEIIRDAVDECGLSRARIAAALGYGKATLDHWFSPSDGREMPFVVAVQVLGDREVLGNTEAGTRARTKAITRLAALWGFSAEPVSVSDAVHGLLGAALAAGSAAGTLQGHVVDAMSDGHVSPAEAERIRQAADNVHQAAATVSAAAQGGVA